MLVYKILALFTFTFIAFADALINEAPDSNSSEPVVAIFALDIPGLHDQDGQGAYDAIIKKTMAGQFTVNIQPLPPKRALAYYERCDHCCFSPGNTDGNFYDFGKEVRETVPMAVAKIFIFSAYGHEPFKHLSELEGKEVGIRAGMPLSNNIIEAIDKKKFNVQYAASLEANLIRLKLGRVEAALGWFPDSELLFTRNKMKPYPYNKAFPVAVHHDALACKGVPERFFQVFNQGIKVLRSSGELQRIIGPGYWAPE
ncbi:substrate-binding periplasmic protein [Thalassomonas haliotis]|uniref:ABC transporter substrate-binding protein n=1 Tax=Thalassomonas haliotis TaxID=485448 RepID=A0ABY7V9S0_9GAMM|nr:ABC transporter substrate-binding protein [Thalassomonas haliotis]WDE10291.1 ABC transporter substrate-binding protein [Thalassomonas haliotis]